MPLHRFTVNVPNPGGSATVARLSLERLPPDRLEGLALELPDGNLEVIGAGITRDPCAAEGEKELELKLAPHESVDVHVVVDTGAGGAGGAYFDLVDARPQRTGGVMLACVEPAPAEPAGQIVHAPNPCPVTLAGDPYAVLPGTDPTFPPTDQRIPLGADLELVAQVTNPGRRRVNEVEVYLEHLGSSDAEFEPRTWSAGTLRHGDVFYASWPFRTSGLRTGAFSACIVVACAGRDTVRLDARLEIVGEGRSRPRSTQGQRRQRARRRRSD
jgi:hypothetical protein